MILNVDSQWTSTSGGTAWIYVAVITAEHGGRCDWMIFNKSGGNQPNMITVWNIA